MLSHRIIPVLLLSNRRLVKTQRFSGPKYVGDPINAIRIFNDKEVDECMVLDISASKYNQEPDFDFIEQLAGECFMPLTYGGGISSVSQARRIFKLGVEKISIQTSAINRISFISELVDQFGSQSIVVSVDIKKSWFGKPFLYNASKSKKLRIPWLKALDSYVEAGAGEILLNSVDRDGTLKGPLLTLVKTAANHVKVPLIALGGVSSLEDIKACVDVGASAVAAGAFFVYYGPHRAVLISYPKFEVLQKLLNSYEYF